MYNNQKKCPVSGDFKYNNQKNVKKSPIFLLRNQFRTGKMDLI